VIGNALPVGHPTGTFPIKSNDPAYQIDRNPNAISGHRVDLSLSLDPIMAATASCVPMGIVGISLNGVAVYNALDYAGEYHYHGPGSCQNEAHTLAHTLAGYAMDGFGLFGIYDDQGREIVNADLDECHGHTHNIELNGSETATYHYHLTNSYPYTVSCYRGSEVVRTRPAGGGLPPPRR